MFTLEPPNSHRNWRLELYSSDKDLVSKFRAAARKVLCSTWLYDPYQQKYRVMSAFHQADHEDFQQFEFWCGRDKLPLMCEAAQDILKEMGMPADFPGVKICELGEPPGGH